LALLVSAVGASHNDSGFDPKKAKQLTLLVSAVGASHNDSGFDPKKAKQLAFS